MWNMKCVIIQVIIGATGIVTKGLKKNLGAISRKHSVDSLQNRAILGTLHIIQKVLQSET
jgi:predicted homoserine dehydrogenase-like protein